MPMKIKVFVLLASASILLTLAMGQWAPLVISGVVLAAAIETRYEARSELLATVRLAIVFALAVVAHGALEIGAGATQGGLSTVLGGLLALLPAAFHRWCLDELDVVRWMLRPRHDPAHA